MKINRINIGQKFKPFIVAELSGNHCNSFDRALRLVEEAARSGASAIKLQTFTPDTMTLNLNNSEFVIKEKTSLGISSLFIDKLLLQSAAFSDLIKKAYIQIMPKIPKFSEIVSTFNRV